MGKMNHGEFRQFVTAGMYEMIQRVINAKSDRRKPYYIIVLVKPYYMGAPGVSRIEKGVAVQAPTQEMNLKGCIGHTRLFVVEPEAMRYRAPQLGTICWKIDNAKGETKLCWALPFDRPNLTEDSDNAGAVAVRVAESAQKLGVPLFWS